MKIFNELYYNKYYTLPPYIIKLKNNLLYVLHILAHFMMTTGNSGIDSILYE